MTARPPKKSETLEVRLPFATKQAFMARCQETGASASEAVRGFIEGYVAPSPAKAPNLALRWGVGALAAAAVAAVAAPSVAAGLAAHADSRMDRVAFEQADANHDGVLSPAEFERAFGR